MAYNEEEIYSLDINWYFRDRFNRICVAASAGGILPKAVMENNLHNENFHKDVMDLPQRYKVIRSDGFFNQLQGLNIEGVDSYFRDFDKLAGRGLYVFDKLRLDDPEDRFYLLVAYPDYNSKRDTFPFDKERLSIIPKIGRSIISRRNQVVSDKSHAPIDLIRIVNTM